MSGREHDDLLRRLDERARAAELEKTLLGSSGSGALDVYDAALARLDIELARLEGVRASRRDASWTRVTTDERRG